MVVFLLVVVVFELEFVLSFALFVVPFEIGMNVRLVSRFFAFNLVLMISPFEAHFV